MKKGFNGEVISKEEARRKMSTAFDEAVQAVKDTISRVNGATVCHESDSSISFTTSVHTSIIDFSYSGDIELIDIDTRFPYLVFHFKQNDSGRFDCTQSLVDLAFIPDSLSNIRHIDSEFDFGLKYNKVKNKTTSFNAFMSSIIDCIKGCSHLGMSCCGW